MELLKNIITPINERVKSPFYSTLIISWLIFNWKIIVALFFYNEVVGGKDKIDYIVDLLSNDSTTIVFPLISAIIYLFILPKIDEFVFEYVEKSKQEKLEKKIDITKAGIVSGERHIDLYNRFMKQKDELATVEGYLRIEKESIDEIKNTLETAKTANKELEKRIQIGDNIINLFDIRNSINFSHRNRFHFKIYEKGNLNPPREFYACFALEYLLKLNPSNEDHKETLYNIIWFENVEREKKLRFLCSNEIQSNEGNIFTIFIFNLTFDGKKTYEGTVKNLNYGIEHRTILTVME